VVDRPTVDRDKEAVMSWFTRLFRRKPTTIRYPERMVLCGTFFRM
jgi:predicted SnoaL-like aldol condensation-catalyzing enzyme